ncbi:MAG: hypothetical protein ACRCR2_02530 [Fusobacteriaceae bacterium]
MINIQNLQNLIHSIEYDYASERMLFNTEMEGYIVPFSAVNISLEPSEIVSTSSNLKVIRKLYGITSKQILDGIYAVCPNLQESW